jgi:hypothetical protein
VLDVDTEVVLLESGVAPPVGVVAVAVGAHEALVGTLTPTVSHSCTAKLMVAVRPISRSFNLN